MWFYDALTDLLVNSPKTEFDKFKLAYERKIVFKTCMCKGFKHQGI